MHEESFGYRVTHHGYLLTSCPGLSVKQISYKFCIKVYEYILFQVMLNTLKDF